MSKLTRLLKITERDTNEYTVWRKAVFKRDGYKCRMPGCKKKKGAIQAHHIVRYADATATRYEVSNGITLHWDCHNEIKDKEKHFEGIFLAIAKGKKKEKK